MGRSLENRCSWFACPTRILAAALTLCVLVGGCGPSGPERVQVRGKIVFNGTPPPGSGSVYFAPIRAAKGFPVRGGYGNFEKGDGSFVVGSVTRDDGLMPGKYRVTIECWERPPQDNGTPGKSFLPDGYAPPELDIKVDEARPVEYNIDVPLHR